MMKRKMAAMLIVVLLLVNLFPASAHENSLLSAHEAVARAMDELQVDGAFAQSDILQDSSYYRTSVVCWQNPQEESVRGEAWYVRFDALDKENHASYIVGLNEDGELRYLDTEPSEIVRQKLGFVSFIEVLDRYQEQYGMIDTWDQAAFMSFATEMRKGRADGRNAWRFQQAGFIPVPENALNKVQVCALAAEAIDYPAAAAAACVCLLDGDQAIYKVSFSQGNGWEYMVELDCMTGEILNAIPFDNVNNKWADCYVPQSIVERLPPQEAFSNP